MLQGSVTIPPTAPSAAAPEGHDAAMVARYEQGQAAAAAGLSTIPAPAAPVAPAAPAATPAPAAPVAPAAPAVEAPGGAFVDTLLTSAGLTREGIAGEYMATGTLKPESYAALAAKGVDKATVDEFLSGVKARAETEQSAYASAIITATVGTPEKYAEVVGWAKGALTPAEIAAFNAAVESGDQARAAFAVAGLQGRFTAANPAEPRLLNQGLPSGGASGYESWAQVKADMATPEYRKDPAFRDKVKARLAVSPANLK